MIKPKGSYSDVKSQEECPILLMDAEEIKERADLNIANTASALRARVVAEQSKSNGHNSKPITI